MKGGLYDIVVRDRSKVHNVHLVGTGVNRKTTLAAARDRHVARSPQGRDPALLLGQGAEDRQGLGPRDVGLAAPRGLHEPRVLAARRAHGRLPVELGVQLRAEEQRERGVVEPEQEDDAARERP